MLDIEGRRRVFEALPPEPAIRMADIRRIFAVRIGIGAANFTNHKIRVRMAFIEIITVVGLISIN